MERECNEITEQEIEQYLASYSNLSKLWSCRNRSTIESAEKLVKETWKCTRLNNKWLFEWALLKSGFLKSDYNVCVFFTYHGRKKDCSNPNHAEGKPKQTYHFCCVCGSKQHGAVGTIHEKVENECKVLTSIRNQLMSLAQKVGSSFENLCDMFGFGKKFPPKKIPRRVQKNWPPRPSTVCLPTTKTETPKCPPPTYTVTSNFLNAVNEEAACIAQCKSENLEAAESPTSKFMYPIEIKYLFPIRECTKDGSGTVTRILLPHNPKEYMWMVNSQETTVTLRNYNCSPGSYSVDMVVTFLQGGNDGYIMLVGTYHE